MNSKQSLHITQQIPDGMINLRLDQALAQLCPEYSRSQLQEWIKAGCVQVDGQVCDKPRYKVRPQQQLEIQVTLKAQGEWQAQNIPLTLLYEDDEILVLNKPAGLVVHPGAGNPDQTLLNALLHHSPDLVTVPRAGIIHRLDKDTTGLLLIAKTLAAHTRLSQELKRRTIKREYLALVRGNLISGGTIEQPIGRHATNRLKMAVTPYGREAVTHYRIKEKFAHHTLLDVELETGRTHQIRVHFNHIHHPIVGDPLYGRHIALPTALAAEALTALRQFQRQALHAYRLAFLHPATEVPLQFVAPVPDDFNQLLIALREEKI